MVGVRAESDPERSLMNASPPPQAQNGPPAAQQQAAAAVTPAALLIDWFWEPTGGEPSVPRVAEKVCELGWGQPYPAAMTVLGRAGYVPGWPEHLTRQSRLQLLGGYGAAECDGCGSSGPHLVHPYRRGASCRCLVRCAVCDACLEI
jgi:hypothetical protein